MPNIKMDTKLCDHDMPGRDNAEKQEQKKCERKQRFLLKVSEFAKIYGLWVVFLSDRNSQGRNG